MVLAGNLTEYDGQKLTIVAPFTEDWLLAKQGITECTVILNDGRTLSHDQRKKIYATLTEISDYTGYTLDESKHTFKGLFIAKTGCEWFSLSDVDMTTARTFLTFLIDFCVEWGVPTADSLLYRSPDIARYIYMCVKLRKCAICGRKAEIHEWDVCGMGRNRKEISHLNQRVQPLCGGITGHHEECHRIGQKDFDEKYHITWVRLDENLPGRLKWKI